MWQIILGILAVVLLIKLWMKLTTGKFTIKGSLKGKVIVMTGGNCGIGMPLWRELAMAGASLHIFHRETVSKQITWYEVGQMKRSGMTKLDVESYEMDMESMASIRKAMTTFLAEYDGPVDILIHNAAIAYLPSRKLTSEGLEATMATNHFGPFLLTHLLMDRLKQSTDGRVISVSSYEHHFHRSPFFIDNLSFDKSYSPSMAYYTSKLCNVMFMRELHRRLKKSTVKVFAVNPGRTRTYLRRHCSAVEKLMAALLFPFAKSPSEATESILYCALSPKATPGEYHSDCTIGTSSALSKDVDIASRLWTESERLTKLENCDKLSP